MLCIEALAGSKVWNCDGTFHSAPKLFYQHYIIHGLYQDERHVPCVYSFLKGKIFKTLFFIKIIDFIILFKGKTTEIYSNFISCLQDEAESLNFTLAPTLIMVDFEQAAIKCFKRAFPGARIKGCFFHFTKAIYKKVIEIGLKVA